MSRHDPFELRTRHRRRALFAVLLLWVILSTMGAVIGGFVAFDLHRPWPRFAGAGAAVGVLVALVATVVAFLRGEEVTLRMVGAEPLPEPLRVRVHNVLDELVLAAGMRRPTLHLIDDGFPNACAIGASGHPGHVCVTRGLVELLEREELAGVLAHELAHLKHEDTAFATMTAALFGTIYAGMEFTRELAEGIVWGRRGFQRRWRSTQRARGAYPLLPVALGVWLALAFLSVVAYFVVLLASRSREWAADLTAVGWTRNPAALASALERIAAYPGRAWRATRGAQHLYFVNPFRAGSATIGLFATHPPIEERIRLLRELAGAGATTAGSRDPAVARDG